MSKIQAEFWKSQFVKGRISRREFIGRVGAIGLTAATAGSIITSAGKVLAATPKKGGRLILGWYTHSAEARSLVAHIRIVTLRLARFCYVVQSF